MARHVWLPARPLFLARPFWEAAVATLWTFVLLRYLVFEFVSSYPVLFGVEPRPQQVQALAGFSMDAGAALLLALFVARGSSRAARRDPTHAAVSGALIATVSVTFFHAIIAIWFPPVELAEIALHLPAAIVGGLLGAVHGRRAQAREEAAYRARVGIVRARRPHDIAAAIGENLLVPLGQRGAVLVWRVPFDASQQQSSHAAPVGQESKADAVAYELAATWSNHGVGAWPLGARLARAVSATLAALPPGRLIRRRLQGLPAALRQRLSPLQSAFVAPLSTAGEPVGLLMIALPRPGRAVKHLYGRLLQLTAQQLTLFRKEESAQWAGMQGERERLADEIHDTIIQGCIALSNRLEDISSADGLDPEDRKDLAQALKISRDTVAEARLFIRALNTDDFSQELPRLLADEAENFREESGIQARRRTLGQPFPLPPNVGMALFKVAREGLANVAKHAHATVVDLELTYGGAGHVSLELGDDGVGPSGIVPDGAGCDPVHTSRQERLVSGGHGLRAMRRLVRNAGGVLSVDEGPMGGTMLSVRFDLSGYPDGLPSSPKAPVASAATASVATERV